MPDSAATGYGHMQIQEQCTVKDINTGSSFQCQEESQRSKRAKENMKLEVDLKEQIQINSAELDTENNTVLDQTLINMKLQHNNISGVQIRLKNDISNIFDDKFVKRAKTEM